MSIETELAQTQFLERGGVLARALAKKQESGELAKRGQYQYQEYPKALNISHGFQDVDRQTETIKGTTKEWVERREVFETIIVNSEEEEERVLSGGKTSQQIEDDRLNLIARCRNAGIMVDTSWSAVRLRRELGDKMDAPEVAAPADKMAALETELANLRKMAEMQQEIDRLRALTSRPSGEADDLRQQLETLGVAVDKRWGVQRLRDELEAATAPSEKVA